MKIIETRLKGLMLLKPAIWPDTRGLFFEAFKDRTFQNAGLPIQFPQDNISQSNRGVVRGLHFQLEPEAQGKLVRCMKGAIWDVALDIRPYSATFGQLESFELNDQEHAAVYIPPGFAHGFQALSDQALIWYKCTRTFSAVHDGGIFPFDPELNIAWPLPIGEVSTKDKTLPTFANWRANRK